jgi:hypothetical protein
MSPADRAPSETRFAVGLACVFAALAVAGALRHEMWRDELEIWLIARDSPDPASLLRNMGTEGHPALWYVLTWLVSRLTRAPVAIQALNVAIATAAAWLVARHAPAPRWVRALVVLGYFPLYEFTVIARSYALELLLLAAFLARLSRRRAIDAVGVALLALLAQTNLFGTIFAGLVLAATLLARWRGARSFTVSWVGVSVVVLAAAVAFGHTLAQSLAIGPDHAGAYRPGWDLHWLLMGLGTVARGFVPLPDFTAHTSWNSSALDMLPRGFPAPVGALAGLLALGLATRALRRCPEALLAFLGGSATLLTLTLFVWFGYARHHGQHFVWFLVCSWLASILGPTGGSAARARARWRLGLATLLAVHAILGARAYLRDLALPFSNARAVAAHVRSTDLWDLPIVGSLDYSIEPIAAYLDRPVWYPESGRYGTFLDWSDRRRLVPVTQALADARALARTAGRDALLILSYPWGGLHVGERAPIGDDATAVLVARFRGALVADENYDLYRVGVDRAETANDNGRLAPASVNPYGSAR